MKYPLLLTRVLVISTTIVLTVTVTNGTDCTPSGTHLSDTTTKGDCSQNNGPLTKDGFWNINWPDSHFDAMTASGVGSCSWQSRCDRLPILDSIECWPDFFPPEATSDGKFSILVVNKKIEEVTRQCGPSIFVEVIKSCATTSQTIFEKKHSCSTGGGGGGSGESSCESDFDCVQRGCNECNCVFGLCSENTPVLIDVAGNGFDLTDAADGVDFDLNGDQVARRIAWTSPASDDAWLVLDRNGNGQVDGAVELFGNHTPQPTSLSPNGFIALAELDKPRNGGNGDGKLNQADAVFNSLRLCRTRTTMAFRNRMN